MMYSIMENRKQNSPPHFDDDESKHLSVTLVQGYHKLSTKSNN